ncbi:MAG: hypothetical protein IPK82_43260 [Polyangiaceae bacterium]|nr:hypothetical protein [Polyangiaceae bacterium]
MKLEPGDIKTRKALEDAYLRAGRVADLVKMLEQSLHGDALGEADARATRERLIDLYLERLKEPEKTIAHVEEVLRTGHDSAVARKAAEGLLAHKVLSPRAASALGAAYEKQGRYADAAKCVAIEVDHYRGPRRVEAQKKLGALKFQKLGDLAGALSLYEQVVVLDPSDDEVRERYRSLSRALDKLADATRVLTRALAGAKDSGLRAKIGVELGEIFVELGDSKKAKVAFLQVIDGGAAESELLRATRALSILATDPGDAKTLAGALSKLASAAPDPEERTRAAADLAKLCETELRDTAGAIEAWRKVLGTPREKEALVALARLYEATGAAKDLAATLERRADLETDVETRRRVLLETAELRSTKLHDRAGAIEALRKANTLGSGREVTQKLIALLEQERRWEDLAAALETDVALAPREEKGAIASRLGQLRLVRLHDVKGAIAAFGDALAADRGDKTARAALDKLLHGGPEAALRDAKSAATNAERLAAAALLENVYRAEGATAALVRVLDTKAGLYEDADERLRALAEAEVIAASDGGDPKRAFELAARGLREAVEHKVEAVPTWLDRVERTGEKGADAQKRADAMASALGDHEVNHPALCELAKKAGDALVAFGDVARALPILRRALHFEPGSPDLVEKIDRLLREQGSPEERLSLHRSLVQKATQPERQRELLHAIAAIERRDLGDPSGAIETYRAILSLARDDAAAQEGLLEAYAEAGQSDALYTELGSRLFGTEGVARANLLVRLAEAATGAGWSQRAAEHYHEAIALGAELHEDKLSQIENLGLTLGDARLVRLVLSRRVSQAISQEEEAQWLERLAHHDADVLHDRSSAAQSYLRAAQIVEELSGDDERARKLYERVLSLSPDERTAALRLLDLYDRNSDHWSSLPSVHDVVIRTAPTQESAVNALVAFESAAIKARAAGTFSAAVATVGKRHGPLPAALWKQVQAALARVLASDVERQDEAAAVFRAMVESAPQDSTREREAFEAFLEGAPDTPARRADRRWLFELRTRTSNGEEKVRALIAWASEEERAGDQHAALDLLRRAAQVAPTNDESLTALTRLQLAVGDYVGAADAIKARRDRADGETRMALEREFMSLQFERLGQAAEALDAAARILEANPGDAAALDIAERALSVPGFERRAAQILTNTAEATADPEGAASVLRRITNSAAFRSPELADTRSATAARLCDFLAEKPDEALQAALLGVVASPFDWSLWERSERLARELSRPDAVAGAYRQALEAEASASADIESFEELGRRAVDFHEEWFDDPDAVTELLKRMATRAPANGWAFERLKLVYNAGEQWTDLFALYDSALAAAKDRDERLALLEDAAGTARDLAGDPERHAGYLEQILALRGDARTRAALERLYERLGHKEKLIALLEHQLRETGGEGETALRLRVARLQLDVGNAEAAYVTIDAIANVESARADAYAMLEQMLREDAAPGAVPRSEQATLARARAASMLESRYRAEHRPRDLVRMLEIGLVGETTNAGKIRRLREIVKLRLEELGDESGALNDVAQLLLLEPSEDGHRETLLRLSERVGKYDLLAATLAEAADRADDPKRRISLYDEAASIERDRTGNIDRAIHLQRAILPLAEGDRKTLWSAAGELSRLLARAGRQGELCDALERLAELASEPDERRQALMQAATIASKELADVDRAERDLERELSFDGSDGTVLTALVDLLRGAGRFEALCRALVRRAEATAGKAARADFLEAAAIAEERLSDMKMARELFERVRRTFGRDSDTGEALARVYERASDWEALARLLEEEAAAETAPERSGKLLCRLGDVHAEHTGRARDAIASYCLAADQGDSQAPTNLLAFVSRLRADNDAEREHFVQAVHALAQIYTERDDWRALLALTEQRLAATSSVEERVAVLHEAATISERKAGDFSAAFDAILRAFEVAPSADLATELRRLVVQSARFDTLAERLHAALGPTSELPAAAGRDLYWDLARHYRDSVHNAQVAERMLTLALGVDPKCVLLWSELCDLLRTESDKRRELVTALLSLSELQDPLEPLREAAAVAEALGDSALTRDVTERLRAESISRFEKSGAAAAVASGGLPPEATAARSAFFTLIRLAREEGDSARIVTLGEEASRLPFPAHDRRAFRMAAAEHAKPDHAITLYRALFDQDATDSEAASRLFALHNARGDREALIEIRARQIDTIQDVRERVDLRLDLAERLVEQARTGAAIEVLRTSLSEQPGSESTLQALAKALEAESRFQELLELWESEAHRRETAGDLESAAQLWLRAATLAENGQKDVLRATRSYRRAAQLKSKDALIALSRLYSEAGQHAEAARAIETLAALATPAEKSKVVLALADSLVAAGDSEQARRHLETALAEVSDAAPLRARLRELHRAAGNLGPLAQMMAEEAETVGDEQKLALLREAAEIHLHLNDPARALPLLSTALTLAPEDLSVRLMWCRALAESGRRDDALASLRALIDGFGGRRPKERALVHHELARVLLAAGERARAVSELDVALRIDPAHPEILQALAKLSLSEGQLDRAHRTFRALLLVARRPGGESAPSGMSRTEILCELSDIAARQGDEARAVEYMESAFDAARESQPEASRLLAALRVRKRYDDLARALTAEIERASAAVVEREVDSKPRTSSPERRAPASSSAQLWSELAALYEGPLNKPDDAVDAHLAALALGPGSATLHEQAAAACSRSNQMARYVNSVSDLAEKSDQAGDVDRTVFLFTRLGQALEKDPARAAEQYERAEQLLANRPLDPRMADIWKALERCYTAQNNAPRLAGILEKRLQIAAGAERVDALYALSKIKCAAPESFDQGLDLLVEASDLDPDADHAEAALRDAAKSVPFSARAAELLERFAREKGRRAALFDALRLRLENERPRDSALREAVALAHELSEPRLAQELLRRAVQRDEAGEGIDPALRVWARTTLADLHQQAGELAEATELREAASRHAEPAEERALLLRVARDSAGALGDLARAARIYEDLRLREPADRDVWEPLADVYRRLGHGARLGALIEDTVPLIESPDERGRLRLERARLVLDSDEARAVDLLKEVLEEDPAQAEAAKLLAGVLERLSRWDDLALLLQQQIDNARDREEAATVTALSMKLGALLEKRGDEHGALDVYHRALDWDGTSRDALRAVLRLSVKLDNSVDLSNALEKLLDVEEGEEAARLALELHDLKAAHGDTPGAEKALKQGFAKCPANDAILARLTQTLGARGAFADLASTLVARSRALTSTDQRIDALCQAADVLREKAKDPNGAAAVLEEALEIDPTERDVLLALIDACEALRVPMRAAAAVSHALTAAPNDAWLYRSRAALYEAGGRPDLALIDLARAHEASAGGYTSDYLLALEQAAARVQTGAVFAEDRPERDLRLLIADLAARGGDLDRARTQLSDLLRKDGKDKGALRALAALEDTAGNWDAASAVYRRLLSLEEGDALVGAALRLADACERADRLGDARGGLERALRAAPTNAAVRDRLRRLYEITGAKAELGLLLAEDARVENDPGERARLLVRAGRLLTEAGDGVRAVAILEEAQRLAPDHPELPLVMASALGAAGRVIEARALLSQTASLHRGKRSKQLGAIFLALSRMEQQAGNMSEALAAMLRAFDNDPQNADLAMDLGHFALELNDAETAGRAFRAVTLLRTMPAGTGEGAPSSVKALAYHKLAVIANAQGDRRKARFMVEKALAEDPQLAEARSLMDSLR